jgi:hypothetical protein
VQADKLQAEKHAGRQAGRQILVRRVTCRQTSSQANKQAGRQARMLNSIQEKDLQTSRQFTDTDAQADRF